jgi:hypothetical protein
MGILTQIVAAEEDEVESIGESLQPVDEWSGVTLREVSIAKLAALHCILTGDLLDDALIHCEPIYVSAAEGALVIRIAAEAAERLAGIDEDALDAIATELAATEEFERSGWDDAEIVDMLADLADLARLAESQGQELFAWLHPLRT